MAQFPFHKCSDDELGTEDEDDEEYYGDDKASEDEEDEEDETNGVHPFRHFFRQFRFWRFRHPYKTLGPLFYLKSSRF